MMKTNTLLFFFMAIFILPVSAQEESALPQETGNGPRGSWHLFTDSMDRKTGVKSVFRDLKNAVWFICNDGIRIYSDTGFSFYDESNGLINNHISCTYTDSKGNIWIGHYEGPSKTYYLGPQHTIIDAALTSRLIDGGVSMFNGREWNTFSRRDGYFNAASIWTLFGDSKGRIWFSSSGSIQGLNHSIYPSGISVYENEKMTNLNSTEVKPIYKFVKKIVEDSSGQIQFYSDNSGLFTYHDDRFHDVTSMTGCLFGSGHIVWQDSKRNSWLFLQNKIKKFDGKEFTVYKEKHGIKIPHNLFFSISETKEGGIIAVGTLGICVFDGTKWNSYKYDKTETTASPDYDKRHAAFDSKGNLWVYINGNFGYFDGNKWTPRNRYLTSRFFLDSRDRVWAPGKKGLTIISEGKTEKFESLLHIRGMMEDAKKNIWLNQNGNLVWSQDGNMVNVNLPGKLKSAQLQLICMDEFGKIWFFTNNGVCYFRYSD